MADVTLETARIAVVHHWLVTYRGGEKVLQSLLTLLPDATLFCLVHDPRDLPPDLQARPVRTSFLQHLPGARRHYSKLLPLMPLAVEQLDLREFDLVVSSDASVVKGVLTSADQLHVCYCHSPPRYLWDLPHDYLGDAGLLRSAVTRLTTHYARAFDARAANGVDHFVANSRTTARRIRKHYRRDAAVVHPPVSIDRFAPAREVGDHYLLAGQLVPYKRPDLAVEAFARLGLPLRVVGDGPLLGSLRRHAPANVAFLGRVDDATWADELSRCRALIFPGEEDFGIVPVEAMASGRPVIALGAGGATETVVGPRVGDGPLGPEDVADATGLFFREATPAALAGAVRRFEALAGHFDPRRCQARAARFDEPRFRAEMERLLTERWKDHAQALR